MRLLSFLIATVAIFLFLPGSFQPADAKTQPFEFDAGRDSLIAYMLSHQLPAQHFEHKPLDDALSLSAFDLYMKQLDPKKRFFYKKDVEQLKAFSTHIDDEMERGLIVLPDAGASILKERISEVRSLSEKILDDGFKPEHEDYLEMDPKKLDYPENAQQMQDLWRRILKLEVFRTYLDLLEKGKATDAKGTTPVAEKSIGSAVPPIDKELWKQALAKVREKNGHYFQRVLQETRQEYYDRYFDSVARAYDPHTNYMAPESKEDFDIHMSGSLEGIGALLREDEGSIKVVRIIPGSAAERQGQLAAEDIILNVSEKGGEPVDLTDMRIREAVSYIRGPKGTEVDLTVQKPNGERMVIPIIRDVVQIEDSYVKASMIPGKGGPAIGYISIPSFYRDFAGTRDGGNGRNVTDDMRQALLGLHPEKLDGLVLDLRNNSGGSLGDAVEISGMFLPGGPVVQVKNSQGEIRVLEDEDKKVLYSGPLVVLVNKFSASASEILAACLQDYGRALIIGGKHTHGKGTVQALMDMNRNLPLLHLRKYEDLGALKITIQKFYRINGHSTQFKGVTPDVVLPSVLENLKSGEQYLDYAMPWDNVEGLHFAKWQGAHFDTDTVRRNAEDWVHKNKMFQKIQEEAKETQKLVDDTKVPVFWGKIWEEHLQAEARGAGMTDAAEAMNFPEDSETDAKKKSLDERLKDDPSVQLTVYLLNGLTTSNHTVGSTR